MKKKLLCTLLAVTLLLGLAACGGGNADTPPNTDQPVTDLPNGEPADSSDSPSAEPVTLKMLDDGLGVWESAMDPIAERWNELHPEAPITIEYCAYGTTDEIIEMNLGMGSTEYDIIAVDTPKVAEYSEKGYLKPLDDYVSDAELGKLQQTCLSSLTYKDQLVVMPMQTGITLLYYNKTLLDQADVTVRENGPDNRLTFEEIVDYCKQALAVLDPNGTEGICGFTWGQVNKTYAMLQLPTCLGGIQIGDDTATLEGVVDSKEWRDAYAFYQSLYNDGVSTYGISSDDANSLFKSGKVLFLMNSYSRWKDYQKNEDYEIVMCYDPMFAGHEDTVCAPTGSWNVGVSAFSKNPEIAAEFVKFYTLGEGHDMWVELNGAFSAVQADVDAIMADPDANYGTKIACSEAAAIAKPRPVIPTFSAYETVIDTLWADLALGADPDTCIANAINTYRSMIG